VLQPPWKLGFGILLTVILLNIGHCQQGMEDMDAPPIEIHVKHGAKFEFARMQAIYFAACHEVAAELWPDLSKNRQSQKLRPAIVLEVGGDKDSVEVDVENGTARVSMRRWSDESFSYAVVIAAHLRASSKEKKRLMAVAAVQTASATVSVEELKKH
jgi:hypothetical protein